MLQITGDAQLGAVPGSPTTNITLNGGQLYNNNSVVTLAANRTISLGASGGYFQPGVGPATVSPSTARLPAPAAWAWPGIAAP